LSPGPGALVAIAQRSSSDPRRSRGQPHWREDQGADHRDQTQNATTAYRAGLRVPVPAMWRARPPKTAQFRLRAGQGTVCRFPCTIYKGSRDNQSSNRCGGAWDVAPLCAPRQVRGRRGCFINERPVRPGDGMFLGTVFGNVGTGCRWARRPLSFAGGQCAGAFQKQSRDQTGLMSLWNIV
jgi:hypothetical protein